MRGDFNIVTFWGRKCGVEKDLFYKSADIFVFPTKNEAFGLVLLEAMQYCLPVIASKEGGIPDIVLDEKTGKLVDKGDSSALANALEAFLLNPSIRKEMGEAGRIRFENNFTEERFEKKMVEYLNTVM